MRSLSLFIVLLCPSFGHLQAQFSDCDLFKVIHFSSLSETFIESGRKSSDSIEFSYIQNGKEVTSLRSDMSYSIRIKNNSEDSFRILVQSLDLSFSDSITLLPKKFLNYEKFRKQSDSLISNNLLFYIFHNSYFLEKVSTSITLNDPWKYQQVGYKLGEILLDDRSSETSIVGIKSTYPQDFKLSAGEKGKLSFVLTALGMGFDDSTPTISILTPQTVAFKLSDLHLDVTSNETAKIECHITTNLYGVKNVPLLFKVNDDTINFIFNFDKFLDVSYLSEVDPIRMCEINRNLLLDCNLTDGYFDGFNLLWDNVSGILVETGVKASNEFNYQIDTNSFIQFRNLFNRDVVKISITDFIERDKNIFLLSSSSIDFLLTSFLKYPLIINDYSLNISQKSIYSPIILLGLGSSNRGNFTNTSLQNNLFDFSLLIGNRYGIGLHFSQTPLTVKYFSDISNDFYIENGVLGPVSGDIELLIPLDIAPVSIYSSTGLSFWRKVSSNSLIGLKADLRYRSLACFEYSLKYSSGLSEDILVKDLDNSLESGINYGFYFSYIPSRIGFMAGVDFDGNKLNYNISLNIKI